MAGLQPTTILAASAGILGSAWNSGKNPHNNSRRRRLGSGRLTRGPTIHTGGQAMLSALAIPGLLSTNSAVPTQILAEQWAGIYNRGKVLGPQAAAISLLGYGYLMYDRSRQSRGWGKYVAAAALTVGIVPFTAFFMGNTNQALLEVAAGRAGNLSSEAVRELLVKWRGLNLVRSLFPLAGALLGLYELVGPW